MSSLRSLPFAGLLAAALLALGNAALADRPSHGAYVGAAIVPAEFQIDDFLPSDDGSIVRVPTHTLRGLMVTGGYQVNRYFAVEGRAGTFSSASRDWRYESPNGTALVPVRISIDATISVYAKAMLPLAQGRLNLYGLGGHTRLRISERTPMEDMKGITANGWDGTNAYGAGAKIQATPQWDVTIEFARHFRRSTESLETTHLGVLYRF